MTQFFTAADGARLAYLDSGGTGLPVLCLAGLTRTKEDFDDALPALAGCRVIRMDYRGRGESEWTGAATYTVVQEGGDALALLDHLGLARAALLGTSRGGLIGLLLCATAHERLLGLCLNDIGPELHMPGLSRIREYVGRRPTAKTLAEQAARMPVQNPGFDGVTPAQWQAMVARLYTEDTRGLHLRYDKALRDASLKAFTDPMPTAWPLWEMSAGLPVALIRGVNSDLLSRDVADRMQAMRPDLIRAEVPGRAHVPFLDEPESVSAIRRWLEKIV